MPADCIMALKPSNETYAEAAAVPSRGTLALYFETFYYFLISSTLKFNN
jgi:hypothetical protein